MSVLPWHFTKSDVYHNNTACNTGNNIEHENRRRGSGCNLLCQECHSLNRLKRNS